MPAAKKSIGRTTPKKQVGPTSAAEWKKKTAGPVELTVPSGNVCLADAPGLPAFFSAGLIPNSLMPIMSQAVDGKGVTEKDLQRQMTETLGDRTKITEMFDMVDNVVLFCVKQPVILPCKFVQGDQLPQGFKVGDTIPASMRDQSALYLDEVDDQDKWFIFNWATGGTSDLERFRTEQSELMASISPSETVGVSAKRAAGASKRKL